MSAWTGALNVYLYTLSPRVGRLVMLVLSATGAAQMLNPVFETLMKLPGAVEKQQEG